MCFRLALRALLLAGREPWLAFLRFLWGLDIRSLQTGSRGEGLDSVVEQTITLPCSLPWFYGCDWPGTGSSSGPSAGRPRLLGSPPFGFQGLTQGCAEHVHKARDEETEKAAKHRRGEASEQAARQ